MSHKKCLGPDSYDCGAEVHEPGCYGWSQDEATYRLALGVRARRRSLGLTQRELADRAFGWSKGETWICNLETGRQMQHCSLDKAAKLAKALDCTIDDLLYKYREDPGGP